MEVEQTPDLSREEIELTKTHVPREGTQYQVIWRDAEATGETVSEALHNLANKIEYGQS